MRIVARVLTIMILLVSVAGIVLAGTGCSDPSRDSGRLTKQGSVGQQCWLPAVNMGDSINSPYLDYSPSLTRDGNHLFFTSDRPGGYGKRDLWEADRVSGNLWRSPVNLGPVINSSDDDSDPWISPDGNLLIFVSNRPGGHGTFDLWMSRKVGGVWQTPFNLGGVINISTWEATPWMSPDTHRLYFGSYERPGGLGGWDIWMSTKTGGVWGQPVNMGPNINSAMQDASPSLTPDEQTLYFAAANGNNSNDVFFSQKVGGIWQPRQNAGPNINSPYNEDRVCITADRKRLYFNSNRPGGKGNWDLYYSDWGTLGQAASTNFAESDQSLVIEAPKADPSTGDISFSMDLPSPVKVDISVYTKDGQKVKDLMQSNLLAGHLVLVWDGRDQTGSKVSAGVYVLRIQAGTQKATWEVTLPR